LCVHPTFSGLPDEELEQVVERSMSALPEDTAEDFMKSLGSLGKTVGSSLQSAAPSIAQGAATGATVGGPWGAMIGAGAGLASASLGKKSPAAPVPAAVAAPSPAGAPTPPDIASLPTGQGAAATVLSLLQNPTVQQALLSQALGASGNQHVRAPSGVNLPRAAINSLLTQLLANASEGLPESEAIFEQDYLRSDSGEYLVDPASPEQQASLVLSRLQCSRPAGPQDDFDEFADLWATEDFADSESVEWTDAEGTETVEFY
jgi:hypothetical protein